MAMIALERRSSSLTYVRGKSAVLAHQTSPIAMLVDDQPLSSSLAIALGVPALSMLGIEGRPLLLLQFQWLQQSGFNRIIIVTRQPEDFVDQQIALFSSLHPDLKLIQSVITTGSNWVDMAAQAAARHLPEAHALFWVQPLRLQIQHEVVPKPLDMQSVQYQHPKRHELGALWLSQTQLVSYITHCETHRNNCQAVQCLPSVKLTEWLTEAKLNWKLDHAYAWQDVSQFDDEGHTDAVAARSFNQLLICPQAGYVQKSSTKTEKMTQEMAYYEQLPQALQHYFPRLLPMPQAEQPQIASYRIEYFPFRSLSQYFVFYPLPLSRWQALLTNLIQMHGEFCRHAQQVQTIPAEQLYGFYWDKTLQRLKMAEQQKHLASMLALPQLIVNGQRLQGVPLLLSQIQKHLEAACRNVPYGFIHGDLCFSNILYDPVSTMVRLIDPRGEFLGQLNQGDPRYDLAKLLHSVHGRYDFIIHDLFTVRELEPQLAQGALPAWELTVASRPELKAIEQTLFALLAEQSAFERNELILLEALLFLTMLPLHADYPKRQQAFLLISLQLLNELYNADACDATTMTHQIEDTHATVH